MIHALRRLRFELGDLTLAQFSKCTSLGTGVISRIENRKRGADVSTLKTLSAQLRISLDQASALCDSSISELDFTQLVEAARAALTERFRGGSDGEEGKSNDAEAASQRSDAGAAVGDSARTALPSGQCEHRIARLPALGRWRAGIFRVPGSGRAGLKPTGWV